MMETRKRRWPSDARIVVERGADAIPAVVSDVSEGGLKVSAPGLVAAAGDPIVIRIGKLCAAGEIKWVRGRSFGLSFRPRLDHDILAHLTGGLYRTSSEPSKERGKSRGWGTSRRGHLHTM